MHKVILILTSLALVSPLVKAQTYEQEIMSFQRELNAEYADLETSPLNASELKEFIELQFYAIDSAYRVLATLSYNVDTAYMAIPTSSGKHKIYRRHALAEFSLNGKDCRLFLYQSQQLSQTEAYKNYLFIPFKDGTSGKGTYGGGRYLDLEIPEGSEIILDFNKAYNPYCAYSNRYNCPIPPAENRLPINVNAGVKLAKTQADW